MKKVALDDDSNEFALLARSRFQPEFLPKHEVKWQVFKYEEPEFTPPKRRAVARLATTDMSIATIQKLGSGGESKLHSHAAQDGFFMVLKGRVAFTGEDGSDLELGPLEGVMIPRGALYAFRQVGDVPLLLLQVEAFHPSAKQNTYKREEKYDAPMADRIDFYDAKID